MTDTTAALDVRLENFEGPLDLLLHLIRKNDLEIADIPIAAITQEYLAYLDIMKTLNLEVAGEFLVMASMLMQIKAHMLLPAPDAEADEGPDPRSELINKLLEYQKFKEAAGYLATAHERAKDVYYRSIPPAFDEDDFTLRASVVDLMEAFKRVLEEAPKEVGQVMREEIPIEVKIREILDRLEEHASVAFESLFHAASSRREMVVTFLALLELIRQKQVVARQPDLFGAIRLYRLDSVPEETPAPAIPNDMVDETIENTTITDTPPATEIVSVATLPVTGSTKVEAIPVADAPSVSESAPAETPAAPQPVAEESPANDYILED